MGLLIVGVVSGLLLALTVVNCRRAYGGRVLRSMRTRFVIVAVVVAWLIASGASTTVTIWLAKRTADQAREASRAEAITSWETIHSRISTDKVIATNLEWNCDILAIGRGLMDPPDWWIHECAWEATIVTRGRDIIEDEASTIIPDAQTIQIPNWCVPSDSLCNRNNKPPGQDVIASTGWPLPNGSVTFTIWILHERRTHMDCPPLLLCLYD